MEEIKAIHTVWRLWWWVKGLAAKMTGTQNDRTAKIANTVSVNKNDIAWLKKSVARIEAEQKAQGRKIDKLLFHLLPPNKK